MSGRAFGIYRPNANTIRLHQCIVWLKRPGFSQEKVAEKLLVSVSTVRYHLAGRCNCGRRA